MLIHTIRSDQYLLEVLRRELSIRGVLPTESTGSEMILFAEQGSLSYIDHMQDILFGSMDFAKPIVIPYLKSIGDTQTLKSKSNGEQTAPSGYKGSVQDYLDRTMAELRSVTTSQGIRPSRVRAVGIIGSRWEDKNLILKKAREVFPTAAFFTTELDARYSLPDVVPHARNLIVASHYGLLISGRDDIFGRVNNIPSFRDGYQTSQFIGMSVLAHAFLLDKLRDSDFTLTYDQQSQNLFDLVGRSGTSTSAAPASLQPLAFEIGSSNPVQMSSIESPDYIPLRQPRSVGSIFFDEVLLSQILVFLGLGIAVVAYLGGYSSDMDNFRKFINSYLPNSLLRNAKVANSPVCCFH